MKTIKILALILFLFPLLALGQPVDPGRAAIGKSVTLTVAPEGGTPPYKFQWYKDDVALPGQTADKLVLAPFVAEQGGLYHVTVSNEAGSITSNKVQLTPVKVPARATITVSIAVGAINP